MAIFKIVPENYEDPDCIQNLVNYCFNPAKTQPYLCGAYALNLSNIEEEMMAIKHLYGKEGGHQVRHFIVSYQPGETIAEEILPAAWEIASFYGQRYQIFFAIHQDEPHIHIHFVLNTVSYVDGLIFSESRADFYKMKNFINQMHR